MAAVLLSDAGGEAEADILESDGFARVEGLDLGLTSIVAGSAFIGENEEVCCCAIKKRGAQEGG